MNATADRSHYRADDLSLRSRIGDWFIDTMRTGRVPALLVAVAAGIVIYGFLFTADYSVRDITVTGASYGDPTEIADASDAFGISVFRIDPEETARRIAALPYVSSSEVTASWPARVEISIVEKQPVLAWRAGADLYLVDQYGATIGTAPSSRMPTIYLETEPGSEFVVTAEQVAAVTAVNDSMGSQITQIEWRKSEGLVVKLKSDQSVIFGDHKRLPQKIAVFSAVAGQISEPWEILDLREPDTPYYK